MRNLKQTLIYELRLTLNIFLKSLHNNFVHILRPKIVKCLLWFIAGFGIVAVICSDVHRPCTGKASENCPSWSASFHCFLHYIIWKSISIKNGLRKTL